MAIKDCIDEIRKLAGEELSGQDVEDIAAEVQRRADAKKRIDGLLSDQEALTQAADEAATEMRIAAQIEARNRAINVVVRRRALEFVRQAVDMHSATPAQALQARMVGGVAKRLGPGIKQSTAARQHQIHADLVGGLIADLERTGVLEFLTRRLGLFGTDAGVADREIARALASIGEDGRATADVPKEMARAAEIIHTHLEAARLRANRAGSFIRKLPGYIAVQSHDDLAIRKAGQKAWADFILPLLDADRTFEGKDPRKFLNGAYDGIASGIHQRSIGAQTDLAFTGPGNRAKAISQERVLHFKDADAWVTYNEKFGGRSLIEAILGQLHRRASDIGLMEDWGTNPRAMFDLVRRQLSEQYRSRPEFIDGLRSVGLDRFFDQLDGTAFRVDNVKLAERFSVARDAMSLGKLGLATLTSINDLGNSAGELRWQGENIGSAYAQMFGNLLEGRGPSEKKVFAAELGVGFEGITGALQTRFAANDSVPGFMTKLMRLHFKANVLNWWTDVNKTGAARAMAFRAAKQATNVFDKVEPRLQQALSEYGISAEEWAVIRQGVTKEFDGRKYLLPKGVRSLPDETFHTLGARTDRQIAQKRDDLATKLGMFYTDRTDSAVVTPGAYEQSLLAFGTARGTWGGELVRAITQFKQFPVSFVTKVLRRDMNGLGLREALLQGKGDILGLAHTIAATTIFGLFSMEAKDLIKGKTPRNPFGEDWAQVWTAALTQGGGLGIYGDYLFGDFSRFGNSPIETAAGPLAGTAANIIDIWSDLRQGTKNRGDFLDRRAKVPAEILNFALNNTPFLNIFFMRTALNYLVLYNLQEMLSPGYLKRSERNLKNQTGQTYLFPPSETVR